jgi:O-methyltransferase
VAVGDLGSRAVWVLWTRTGLGRHVNGLTRRFPAGLMRTIDRLKREMRYWQPALRGRLASGREPPLVRTRELEEAYRNELTFLAHLAGPDGIGDYLEFGVYVGSSLLCMHRASLAAGQASIRLFGFDSFQGLPEAAAEEEGGFRPGWYHAGYDLVRQHLSRNGIDWGRTVLVPGWFDQTLEPELAEHLGIEKASVIMIDCDLYSSTRTALTFCAPLIKDRAVIFFDDWPGDGPESKELGERRAFDEFLANHPDLSAEERGPYPWRVGPRTRRFGKTFLLTRRIAR